jgi:hypothetical protein
MLSVAAVPLASRPGALVLAITVRRFPVATQQRLPIESGQIRCTVFMQQRLIQQQVQADSLAASIFRGTITWLQVPCCL